MSHAHDHDNDHAGHSHGVSADADRRWLSGHRGVREVHDLHVWEVTSGFPALAAHVLVPPGDDCHATRRELEGLLERDFDIHHTTPQVDHEAQSGPLPLALHAPDPR